MLPLLPCGGTLCSLNNNIIEYILNSYLSYKEDILKIKKLYSQFRFKLKAHLSFKKAYQFNKEISYIIFYLDNSAIKQINYNKNKKVIEYNFKNKKRHGIQKYFGRNGKIRYINCYYNGELCAIENVKYISLWN
jgi:antitoxin component YwqK of YwqJK toxin-antitoxin module